METIEIQLLSRQPHLSQILTGFQLLAKGNHWKLRMKDCSEDGNIPHRTVLVRVFYRGKCLIYDTLDGYQCPEAIAWHLEHCDYYFKRSFSPGKNQALGLPWQEKMFPLGFNYHVSCRNHPMDPPFWKEAVKEKLGLEHNSYSSTWFTPARFETRPRAVEIPKVLFCTRLWPAEPGLPAALLEERRKINQMRIDILRRLRENKEIRFLGGLSDSAFARTAAPELILPAELTDRKHYLKCLRASDICIGTMGLHESIGWKTGEYVAAAKGILNERLRYQVPGDFQAGKHYLEFETADGCMEALAELTGDPQMLFRMQQANREYYLQWLRPDKIIGNTLKIVEQNG